MQKPKNNDSLLGSIKSRIPTLGKKKATRLPPQVRDPDNYYKRLWLKKAFYEDIAIVEKVEGISFKKASELVFEKGFKLWLAEIISQQIEDEKNPDRPRIAPKAIRALRKFIKDRNIPNKHII